MLLRRPKPPKLDKIDLSNVHYPDSDTESVSTDSRTLTPNYNKTKSSESTEQDFAHSSSNSPAKQVKSHRVDLPRLTILTNEESLGDKTPKTMPNSVLDSTHDIDTNGENRKKSNESENGYYYMKSFDKHAFKARMSPIKSAEITHKTRKETLESRDSLVKPFRPPGLSSLPKRPLKFHHDDFYVNKKFDYDAFYSYDNSGLYTDRFVSSSCDFKLNDFFLSPSDNQFVVEHENKKIISTANYKRVNKLYNEKASQSSHRGKVHVHTLIPSMEAVESRKPTRQSLIEMASYLKEELKKKTGANLKTKFQPISKWQRANGAQTELVIFEESRKNEEEKIIDEEITPSKIAILDCLLNQSEALSLKGYFIDKLPDLKELNFKLRYINISYNNFKEIPPQILSMRQLEVFKMRSNPIRYLSDKLSDLQNLKVLVFSYCQLNEIPECVLELNSLQHLDLSYNRIKEINQRIDNLMTLKTLNLEGNEIEFMPCCMLNMYNLKQINVKNNYLHPIIWRKLQINSAQSLFTLCAIKFNELYGVESEQFDNLTEEIKRKLRNYEGICDCCEGKRYDQGLKIIRPHIKIFQVKYLPFMFISCSPSCLFKFKTSYLEA